MGWYPWVFPEFCIEELFNFVKEKYKWKIGTELQNKIKQNKGPNNAQWIYKYNSRWLTLVVKCLDDHSWLTPIICLSCQFPVFLSNSSDLAGPEEHFPFPHSAQDPPRKKRGKREREEEYVFVWVCVCARWGVVRLNLTHCSGQWAAYQVYPNMGACFAKSVERRSTLLNQCLLRALCMQYCYVWNHRRQ